MPHIRLISHIQNPNCIEQKDDEEMKTNNCDNNDLGNKRNVEIPTNKVLVQAQMLEKREFKGLKVRIFSVTLITVLL